jgi:hypothetical protein
MAFITDDEINNLIDIPIQLPLTQLFPGAWIVLGTYEIPIDVPSSLTLRWMQMSLLETSDGTTTYTASNGCGGFTASATLGIYLNYTDINQAPTGAVVELGLSGPAPTTASRDLALAPYTTSTPGLYTVVLIADPTYYTKLTVNGALRANTNAL